MGIINGEVANNGKNVGAYKVRELQRKFKVEIEGLKVYIANHGELEQIEKILSMRL